MNWGASLVEVFSYAGGLVEVSCLNTEFRKEVRREAGWGFGGAAVGVECSAPFADVWSFILA